MSNPSDVDTMQNHFKITIEGAPQAKGRPRFARRGKFVSTYTPKKTMDAETTIKLVAKSIIRKPLEGAVSFFIALHMPIPSSYSKKRSEGLKNTPHMKRPDIDNLIKLVMDSLNGVAWDDDNQVVKIGAVKIYSDNPRTEIEIEKYLV